MRWSLALCALLVVADATNVAQVARIKQLCPPCAAVAGAQRGVDDLPEEALLDRGWALGPKGVNAPVAAAGAPLWGTTSTIVQIDTGVTAHPLLYSFDGTSGVDFNAANGLYGVGQTNIDPLLSGLLRFPGHGTKTASVIVARRSGLFDGVSGVAPGARLVPVRATEGVLLLPRQIGELNADMHRVARAINEAANDNGLFGRRVDVITMSLGGWPDTPDLCDAVKKATDRGLIVLAAAGNEIRRAKYPARCPTAIGIAGSTIRQQPWRGSAGAAEVAVAAPAEGVWTASIFNGVYCLDASSGTSFAVALVAGIAAEWVAEQKRRGLFPTDPAALAGVHRVFKDALRASARPWQGSGADGWRRRYGAGIVDMSALLRQGQRP
jgi:subtilisin family serine protease